MHPHAVLEAAQGQTGWRTGGRAVEPAAAMVGGVGREEEEGRFIYYLGSKSVRFVGRTRRNCVLPVKACRVQQKCPAGRRGEGSIPPREFTPLFTERGVTWTLPQVAALSLGVSFSRFVSVSLLVSFRLQTLAEPTSLVRVCVWNPTAPPVLFVFP